MGFFPGEYITSAAQFLLRELDACGGCVRYSKFYDGETVTSERVASAIGIDVADESLAAAPAIDLAAYELEDEGLVEIEELDEPLADGEPDYLITLTGTGREFFSKGGRYISAGRML